MASPTQALENGPLETSHAAALPRVRHLGDGGFWTDGTKPACRSSTYLGNSSHRMAQLPTERLQWTVPRQQGCTPEGW